MMLAHGGVVADNVYTYISSVTSVLIVLCVGLKDCPQAAKDMDKARLKDIMW